ncbi:transcriptional regulator [Streptomyces daqingensis]|uniref:Transcriptional regulator n=1 Tax=Streptomyces daqingensis TaxID=1472640 RepID=A0ABQ2M1V6_9ACTN|nr:transcriptional regulator [Streptomyces daqingensis]
MHARGAGAGSRVTLQTVADVVGVSRATVSNAYNRPERLGAELREQILDAARQLGYPGPNPAARQLRLGRSGMVGLLFTEPLSYAFSDPAAVLFLGAVARECETANAGLLLLPSPPNSDMARTLRGAVVDSMCIYSMPEDHEAVQAVMERQLPTVFVDQPRIRGTAFVGVDDRHGGRLVGEHVTALGHHNVGILTPRLLADDYVGPVGDDRLAASTFRIFKERFSGIRDALRHGPLPDVRITTQERNNTPEDGEAGAHVLLDSEPRPTAILGLTDQLALGALRAARARGLSVPGDLTLTGFDDIPEAATSDPPLTTIQQPLVEKGTAAGRLLLDLLQGGPAKEEMLNIRLLVRESSGPAREG